MIPNAVQLLTATLISQYTGLPLPTAEDHLRVPGGEKRIVFIMDTSCSMGWGEIDQAECDWFVDTLAGGDPDLDKMQQMKSALVGCTTANDGVLDRWAGLIDIAIVGFGYNLAPEVRLVQTFTDDKTVLENAVLAFSPSGETPIEWGIMAANDLHNTHWTNATADSCDEYYNVIFTDGVPDEDPETPDYSWASCDDPQDFVGDEVNPYHAAAYVYQPEVDGFDALCNVDGEQMISTYSVGFGDEGNIDPAMLQDIATAGGGSYHFASDVQTLTSEFNNILSSVMSRTTRLTGPTISSNGIFVSNLAYSGSFKPLASEPWIGNMKAYCIEPPRDPVTKEYLDETVDGADECIFKVTEEGLLVTNTEPVDQFTGTSTTAADEGGVGEVLFLAGGPYFGELPGAPVSGGFDDHFTARKIYTWTGGTGYEELNELSDLELFAYGCARTKLLAYLYGFEPSTVDCATGLPTQFADWPIASAATAQPTLIKWGQDCTDPDSHCLVALNTNDGGVHFFDSETGLEYSAVIPRELFRPGYVGNYPLSQVLDQPTAELVHRPYNDGSMLVVHEDNNNDGVINNSERAYLVWGLGRGGAAYYFMDITEPFTIPSTADNPIYTIASTPDTWTENLRNTLAAPWVGRVKYSTGATGPELAAVIPSGHVWYLDRPEEDLNATSLGLRRSFDPSAARNLSCEAFAVANGYPDADDFCELFQGANYDAVMTAGVCNEANEWVSSTLSYAAGVGTGAKPAGAIGQLTFSTFDLAVGDSMTIEDVEGNILAGPFTGNQTGAGDFTVDVWITTMPFHLRFTFDGVCNANAGVVLDSLLWIEDRLRGGCYGGNACSSCDTSGNGQCTGGECGAGASAEQLAACALCDSDGNGNCSGAAECDKTTTDGNGEACAFEHKPFVAFVSLDLLEGEGAFSSTSSNDLVRLMFTSDCTGISLDNGECVDQTMMPDLAKMKCPIVATVRAYDEGGVGKAWYVGDQCGIMWKFWWQLDATNNIDWYAKALFEVNALDVVGSRSSDYRRFDRPVDLVLSQCKGNRSVGVYFGTGNTARPGATDNLKDDPDDGSPTAGAVTAFAPDDDNGDETLVPYRNIIGVLFDSGQLNNVATPNLESFVNLSQTDSEESIVFEPTGANLGDDGFFFALRENEQMLRDPLVFQGVAFYKTNEPSDEVNACENMESTDRIYAFDNCTGLPSVDANGDGVFTAGEKVSWSGATDVGGGIMVYIPPTGAPIISAANLGSEAAASAAKATTGYRSLRLYMFWELL